MLKIPSAKNQSTKTNTQGHQQATSTAMTTTDPIRIYHSKKTPHKPSKIKLGYDMAVLLAIVVDLLLIFFDQIVMSTFFTHLSTWFGIADWQAAYQAQGHYRLATLGGFFTLFLIAELAVRWLIAIKKRTYYRWFFFPFVHWYEVLGCFPLLRPLRLLRALIIIKRLHDIGVSIIPARWIKTVKFYGHMLLEELSDRVILTAIANLRNQLRPTANQTMVASVWDNNRHEIEQALLQLLRHELAPKLRHIAQTQLNDELSAHIGQAVVQALSDTPELRRYLKLIPIAGAMIEAQMLDIGKSIGEQVTQAVNQSLLDPAILDKLMGQIATGVAQLDINHPALNQLIANIIDDGLTAFETQIKIQQYKHSEHWQS